MLEIRESVEDLCFCWTCILVNFKYVQVWESYLSQKHLGCIGIILIIKVQIAQILSLVKKCDSLLVNPLHVKVHLFYVVQVLVR